MSVIVGTDSYVSEAELAAYATARGITLVVDPTIDLIKAMDYLSVQPWAGSKTDPLQPLDFPRGGSTTVPQAIKTAQMQLAILADSGVDLLAPVGPAVKREKVDVLEVEYQDYAGSTTSYPMIDALLRQFLLTGAYGASFAVSRA